MKKLLFFAAATAVALSSCSKDEVTATAADAQKAISFSAYSASATKATATDLEQLEDVGFIVSSAASSTSDTVNEDMENEDVAWSDPNWIIDNDQSNDKTYYWPTDGSVDFVAVSAKHDATVDATINAMTAGTSPTVTYTTGTSAASQDDLVIAYAAKQTASTDNGNVPLTFVHALSKVGVTVKANTTNEKVKFVLSEITLNDVNTAGTATVTSSDITWEKDQTDSKDTNMLFNLTSTSTTNGLVGVTSPTYATVIESGSELLVLPTSLSTMTVKGQWQTSTDGTSYTNLGEAIEETVTFDSFTLASNTVYDIQLTVTPKLPISFSVNETTVWESDTEEKPVEGGE